MGSASDLSGAGPEWAEETKNSYRSFLNRVQLHRTDRQRDTIRHRAQSRKQIHGQQHPETGIHPMIKRTESEKASPNK